MKILGLIPARGGSKGVKRKNIKILGNKPLIAYTIEIALKSEMLDRVVVTTEDKEIAEIAVALGADVPFMRPQEMSLDSSPSIDAIRHALNKLSEDNYEAVCLLQPTYPFRALEDLNNAIKTFISSSADTLISMVPVPHEYHPDWVYLRHTDGRVLLANGKNQPTSRRQNLSPAFIRDGAIYITKTSVVLTTNSLYGNMVVPYEMKHSNYINIDTPSDWSQAEEFIAKRYG